jgi:hypothetical protein
MASRALLVGLGVLAAACTDLPTITAAPVDGGVPTDAGTPDASLPTDAGTPDASLPTDAGRSDPADRPIDCQGRGLPMTGPEIVDLLSGPAYCDDGWTLVLKANGGATPSKWTFDSPCWTGGDCMLPSTFARPEDVRSASELRPAAFDRVAGKEVRVVVDGMTRPERDSFVYAQNPRTLGDVFTNTSLSYNAGDDVPAFLPPLPVEVRSGKVGLMVGVPTYAQVRIGFVGAGDSRPVAWTGVGGKIGLKCFPPTNPDPSPSAGSAYAPSCAGGVTTIESAVVYVYVR